MVSLPPLEIGPKPENNALPPFSYGKERRRSTCPQIGF